MSLKYAILGLLSFQPQTGYEIKSNFTKSIRYLWNADQAQIYRMLSRIAQEGLVRVHTVVQKDRPNRKVYELTTAGLGELKTWLAGPVESRDQRNAELLQIFFSGQIDDQAVLANLRRLRRTTEAGLASLQSLEESGGLFDPSSSSAKVGFFFNATLDLGIRSARMNLEWLDSLISRMEGDGIPGSIGGTKDG